VTAGMFTKSQLIGRPILVSVQTLYLMVLNI
jgi:hypothetical protein